MRKECMGRFLVFLLAAMMLTVSVALGDTGVSLSEQEARTLALEDAKVALNDLSRLSTEMEMENGEWIYDISFTAGHTKYEYHISRDTGAVRKRSYEPTASYALELIKLQPAGNAVITPENALAIALDTAGLASALDSYVELDKEDGLRVYDVTLYGDNTIYEIDVDCMTGQVYSFSQAYYPNAVPPRTDAGKPSSTGTQTGVQTSTQTGGLTLAEAKDKALRAVGLSASQVTFTQTKRDFEDGVAVYEIEFVTDANEYDFEIAIETGVIRKQEIEVRRGASANPPAASSSSALIGIDRAKSIAVSNAGYSKGDVTFTKAKLERDDGVQEYEIEFRVDGREFEYDIRATDGKILSASSERYSTGASSSTKSRRDLDDDDDWDDDDDDDDDRRNRRDRNRRDRDDDD